MTDALPKTPDYLIDLSLQLGIDLTPNGDLEERLDAAVLFAGNCQQDLAKLVDTVRVYELSVVAHTPVDRPELDRLISELKHEQRQVDPGRSITTSWHSSED